MNSVPIATKQSLHHQHYPAFSLPTHTNDTLHAIYEKQASFSPRSVSVSATSSNYMDAINENPYQFLTKPHAIKSLKTLCSTSTNLPTLLRASLEANLRGMVNSGECTVVYVIAQIPFPLIIEILSYQLFLSIFSYS